MRSRELGAHLRAAEGDAEAGHHLVEDEQSAVVGAHLPYMASRARVRSEE